MQQISFWERSSFLQYSYIVIGAGTVGLHTAIALRKKYPAASIAILEQGVLPTGASTKNAGFACMGSYTELASNIDTDGAENMQQLFSMRYQGLQITRALLGDNNIGYYANGSYELISNNTKINTDELNSLNQLLYPIINQNAFKVNNNIIAQSGFNHTYFTSAITNIAEGELHTGTLIKALWQYAMQHNIYIHTGCAVTALEPNSNGVNVVTSSGITFSAGQVVVCTNAFATTLLPSIHVVPGRGQVLITKPIYNLPFKGIYHFMEGYYYFRVINNCVLFGGGRNIDFAGETTTTLATNQTILAELHKQLANNILPTISHTVDYNWSGIMAFGVSKQPIIMQMESNIYCAVRCGGMGVAIGSVMAQNVVALM